MAKGHLDELQKAEKYPINRQVSLYKRTETAQGTTTPYSRNRLRVTECKLWANCWDPVWLLIFHYNYIWSQCIKVKNILAPSAVESMNEKFESSVGDV